jgi:hypothetical protein
MEMLDLFKVVVYKYPTTFFKPCNGLWQAQHLADNIFRESGFKDNAVVEYDGEVIYRAQRRPTFSI